jgi:sRNA-binding regulator protein Hfq
MTSKAEQLIGLAEAAEFRLSEPELKLLRCVATGAAANFSDNDEERNNPERAGEWGEERWLSAELIAWVCTDRDAREFITRKGLWVAGAKIEGSLDLSFARMEFPLGFLRCAFTEMIQLSCATVKMLNLAGSWVGLGHNQEGANEASAQALIANALQVQSDVVLSSGFSATGTVWLIGATIGGNLQCDNGTFTNEGGDALLAQGAEVKGNVFFRNSFSATGRVWLVGATIGGDLDCSNSTFTNKCGYALVAEGTEIKGSVLLSNEFSATGQVSLLGASIGGHLECDNGTFINEDKDALVTQGAEIKGNIFLRNGFSATGRVSLSGASIGGHLDCDNGTFTNEGGDALLAQGAEIKGGVLLSNRFSATGRVSLLGATIGGHLDCDNGTFTNEGGDALLVQGAEIKGNVFLRNGFSATGTVSLVGASLEDGLDLKAMGPGDMELDLRFATVSVLMDEKDSWPKTGKLDLDGFTYEKIANGSPVKGSERLDWIQRQNLKESFSPQPYEQAAYVLRASGYEQAATEVLIGKQEDLRQYGNLSRIGWFWNWFLGHTIAHGYKPHYALYWATGFIAAGTTLFGLGYGQNPRLISPANVVPFEVTAATAPQLSEDYPKFNALVYSLDVFVPIVDFHQKSYWLPNANRGAEIPLVVFKCQTGALLRWYFWLHIVAGWVLTSLWVAGFTGLVRQLE